MILDNLSLVGLFVASLYLFLPLLFGKEIWRVDEEGLGAVRASAAPAAAIEDTPEGHWAPAPASVSCIES